MLFGNKKVWTDSCFVLDELQNIMLSGTNYSQEAIILYAFIYIKSPEKAELQRQSSRLMMSRIFAVWGQGLTLHEHMRSYWSDIKIDLWWELHNLVNFTKKKSLNCTLGMVNYIFEISLDKAMFFLKKKHIRTLHGFGKATYLNFIPMNVKFGVE